MHLGTKISDKYATLSMPGSFRKVKSSLFGIQKMPDDPLMVQRQELDDFDMLLNTLTTVATSVQTAVEMLAAAPSAMFDPLQRFYPQDVGGHAMVNRMCSQLGEFSVQARKGDEHLQAMHKVLQELSQQNAAIRGAFHQRDIIYNTYAHYTTKVEGLQDQIARGGSSAKLIEKLNRNVQKKRAGEEAFQARMNEVGNQVNEVLSGRWHRLSSAVSNLCRYYATVFEASEHLVRDFTEVGQALVLTTTSEAMMKKGQELAAQAKEKLSSFTNTFQQRAADARHSAAATVAGATAAWSGGGTVGSWSMPGSMPGSQPPQQGMPNQGYQPGFQAAPVQAGDTAAGCPPAAAGGFPGGSCAAPSARPAWPGGAPPTQSWGPQQGGYATNAPPESFAGYAGGGPGDPFMGAGAGAAGCQGACGHVASPPWGSGGCSPPPTSSRQVRPGSMPGQGPWEKMAQATTPSVRGRTPWA